jgi:hypothetical protein
LIICCNANGTLVDRVDLPLNRLPASRLLLPRSGLERSDFVLWVKSGHDQAATTSENVYRTRFMCMAGDEPALPYGTGF